MSADRLSFNQGADEDDDGARWEAYLALLRRTGGDLPTPDAEAESGDVSGESEETGEPPEPVEVNEAASLADEPLRLDDRATSAKLPGDSGLRVGPRASRPVEGSFRRNSRLVVWTMALTAGIIFAVSLVPRQQDRRDTRIQIQPLLYPPQSSRPHHPGVARLPAEPAAPITPPSSAPPASPPAVVPAKVAPRLAPHHPQPAADHPLRQREGVPGARARHQSPQCWTSVPTPDHKTGEARLTDCPSFGPPPEATTATLRWQATPTPAPRP